MTYYRLYKILLDDEEYEEVSLLAKVAYGVYVDMMREDIYVKQDERGKKYIENARKYLMNELNICANTVTKINKELIDAELIEEEWQGMNLPYKTYIKYYETIKLENTTEDEYLTEICPIVKYKDTGFENADIQESQEVLLETFDEFPFLEVGRITKNVQLKPFSEKDQKMIKYAIAYMLVRYNYVDNIKDIMKEISQIVLLDALNMTAKMHNYEAEVCNLSSMIFDIIFKKYKNLNN